MKEKEMQVLFSKYLKANPPNQSEAYELKICKGSSLSFSAVKDHQIKGLLDATNGLYHKISDSPIFAGSMTRFTNFKPCDCLYLKNVVGYVVILFYKPRKFKITYIINIRDFLNEKERSNRKSLTEGKAIEIASKIIILKNKYE